MERICGEEPPEELGDAISEDSEKPANLLHKAFHPALTRPPCSAPRITRIASAYGAAARSQDPLS